MKTITNAIYTAKNKTWNVCTPNGNGIIVKAENGTTTALPYTNYPIPPGVLTLPEIPDDKKEELIKATTALWAQINDKMPKSNGHPVIQTIIIDNGKATVDYVINKTKVIIL